MSRNNLIELAGTLQAARVYLLEQGVCYQPAADALIDVLVELHRAAQWRDWELRRIGRVAAELTRTVLGRAQSVIMAAKNMSEDSHAYVTSATALMASPVFL